MLVSSQLKSLFDWGKRRTAARPPSFLNCVLCPCEMVNRTWKVPESVAAVTAFLYPPSLQILL